MIDNGEMSVSLALPSMPATNNAAVDPRRMESVSEEDSRGEGEEDEEDGESEMEDEDDSSSKQQWMKEREEVGR